MPALFVCARPGPLCGVCAEAANVVISRRRRWALRYTESVIGALPASGAGGGISVVKGVSPMREGFDNDKYIELQAERIRERMGEHGA